MEVTKKQQALASVFGLALIALVADRMLPGPDGAQAAFVEPPAQASAPEERVIDIAQQRAGVSIFAAALRTVAEDRSLAAGSATDAFDRGDLSRHRAQTATSAPDTASSFLAAHGLTSVIVGDPGAAVVDGDLVRLGERFDGFLLVRVGQRSAEFAKGQVRVTLMLPVDR